MISPMIFGREEGFTFSEILAAMGIAVFAVMSYPLTIVNLFSDRPPAVTQLSPFIWRKTSSRSCKHSERLLTPMYAQPEAIMAFRQDPAPRVFLIDVGVLRYRRWERALSKST